MVMVNLKGVQKVRAGGRVYYYAWRGGPRLEGEPGSPDFLRQFQDAHRARKQVVNGTFLAILTAYRASPEFTRLGAHTQRSYRPHLDALQTRFGSLPAAALDDPRVRRHFIAWRDTLADRPRTADMAMGVLKRVLGWALERVLVTSNQATPIGRLHRADRSDSIWSDAQLAAFQAQASPEVWRAVQLAVLTGLRQSDLIRLAWGHIEGDTIAFRTSKRGRRVLIPVTPALRQLLDDTPRLGPIILTTRRGKRPWTADGLRTSFSRTCTAAGVDRTFHDLRRTAATNLLSAGLDASQVALLMGWSERDIEALKRRYVSRAAVVQAVLAKLGKVND